MLSIQIAPDAGGYIVRKSLGDAHFWVSVRSFLAARETLPLLIGGLLSAGLCLVSDAGLLSMAPIASGWLITMSLLSGKVLVLGLFDQGRLVGGLRMRLQPWWNRAVILGIYVEPDHRRAGAGTALVQAAVREASGQLSGRGVLVAYSPTHPASRRIFDKHWGGTRLRLEPRGSTPD